MSKKVFAKPVDLGASFPCHILLESCGFRLQNLLSAALPLKGVAATPGKSCGIAWDSRGLCLSLKRKRFFLLKISPVAAVHAATRREALGAEYL